MLQAEGPVHKAIEDKLNTVERTLATKGAWLENIYFEGEKVQADHAACDATENAACHAMEHAEYRSTHHAVMAYTVLASTVMPCIVLAYILMAYTVSVWPIYLWPI